MTDQATPTAAPANKITITITDQAAGKSVTAQVPTDVAIERLLPALVTKMSLPTNVQYQVMLKRTGQQLQPSDTLAKVGVQAGDVLRLMPNVTAG